MTEQEQALWGRVYADKLTYLRKLLGESESQAVAEYKRAMCATEADAAVALLRERAAK